MKARVSRPSVARKITAVLFSAQALASAAFIATSTVTALAGAALSGARSWVGAPAAVSTIAGAGSAFLWGLLMDRIGRRRALSLGLLAGAFGAAGGALAIAIGSFPLFLAAMVLTGVANAAMTLSRFAAADVHEEGSRGRALSTVILGGTLGAIGGPLLVAPAGRLAVAAGTGELAGAFGAAVFLLLAAGWVVAGGLRPEPTLLARELAGASPAARAAEDRRPFAEILRVPAAGAAVAAMVLSQAVMAAVMVITSVYMEDMHHGLGDISLVFSSHTIGMYGFSLLSGRLVDRWGRRPVIILGAGFLVAACLSAPLTGATFPIALSLLMLGLGWNFCFVAGSTLFADQLRPAERGRAQGLNDLLVGLASAAGSLGSGILSARFGYAGVGMAGGLLALLPLFFVVRWDRAIRRLAA